MSTRKRRPRAKCHDQWVARCLRRSLPDESNKTFTDPWTGHVVPDRIYSKAVLFTGLTPDGKKATFELENGGVAILPYPQYLKEGTDAQADTPTP